MPPQQPVSPPRIRNQHLPVFRNIFNFAAHNQQRSTILIGIKSKIMPVKLLTLQRQKGISRINLPAVGRNAADFRFFGQRNRFHNFRQLAGTYFFHFISFSFSDIIRLITKISSPFHAFPLSSVPLSSKIPLPGHLKYAKILIGNIY